MKHARVEDQTGSEEKKSFRARNPERDLLNDDERIERLDGLLQDVLAEVRAERKGLRQRYESSLDNEIRPLDMRAWSMQPSDILTDSDLSLAQCVARLKKLEAQDHILQQIQQDLARLQGLTIE